jgi:drug/metabolite transporter (DMT)-like permease
LVGGLIMLGGGLASEGWRPLSARVWAITIWMAVVNTALAFTLWNHSLKVLTAAEASAINGSLTVQVPILAVIFLGEIISSRQLVGMGLIILGVILVQFFRKRKVSGADTTSD